MYHTKLLTHPSSQPHLCFMMFFLFTVEQLATEFTVFEECLDIKSKSLTTALNNLWAKQYRLMSEGLPQITNLTDNGQLTTLLSMEIFQIYVNNNLSEEPSKTEPDSNEAPDKGEPKAVTLTPKEIDISSYIGGSVLSKLRKKYVVTRSHEKNIELENFIANASDDSSCITPSLTSVKSRGGLIYLTQCGTDIFHQLEVKFQTYYPEVVTEFSIETYRSACYPDMALCSKCPGNPTKPEKEFFLDMVDLYFKIRSYAKLRNYLEQFLNKSRTEKKKLSERP